MTDLKKNWGVFSQTVTITLGIAFVVGTFKPDWLSDKVTPLQVDATQHLPRQTGVVSYADAAKKAMPAVVNIFTSKAIKQQRHPLMDDPMFKYFFGDRFGEQHSQSMASLGSGVIVSPEGYILTNNHVIEEADEIEVALADGRKTNATLVGADPETDLAVLKINLPKLPVMAFAPSEQAQIGDVVLAIGNPFGVGQTVTMGIISATGRNHLGINTFENFIQTDAAINPGNSGGALVNTQGNLLAINSAIYSRSGGSLGIGFAIPSNTAQLIMTQLIKHGEVVRGFIGVEPQDLTPDIIDALKLTVKEGALVAAVIPQGPAGRAGVQQGDVIIKINDVVIKDSTTMLNAVANLKPKSFCTIDILRAGKPQKLTALVLTRPAQKQLQTGAFPRFEDNNE